MRLWLWRWLARIHDSLHQADELAVRRAITEKYGTWRGDPKYVGEPYSFTVRDGDTATYSGEIPWTENS